MILDTGANVSSIPSSLANKLVATGHAEEGPPAMVTLANGTTENERIVFVDALTIGRHTTTRCQSPSLRASRENNPSIFDLECPQLVQCP
jgi:Aspartyl protease